MIKLFDDGSWQLKDLGLFVESVEIRKENGKLMGLFVPANLERGEEHYERSKADIDWVEVERRAKTETGGRTLAEVMAYLESLPEDFELPADQEIVVPTKVGSK